MAKTAQERAHEIKMKGNEPFDVLFLTWTQDARQKFFKEALEGTYDGDKLRMSTVRGQMGEITNQPVNIGLKARSVQLGVAYMQIMARLGSAAEELEAAQDDQASADEERRAKLRIRLEEVKSGDLTIEDAVGLLITDGAVIRTNLETELFQLATQAETLDREVRSVRDALDHIEFLCNAPTMERSAAVKYLREHEEKRRAEAAGEGAQEE